MQYLHRCLTFRYPTCYAKAAAARYSSIFYVYPAWPRRRMISRIFKQRPHPTLAHHATALSYSQFDLALLSLCSQAIAYYVRTGHWPKLAPHDTAYCEVWPDV